MENTATYTAALPRLYDRYVQATASTFRPDTDKAIAILTEIRNRVEGALALLEKRKPERVDAQGEESEGRVSDTPRTDELAAGLPPDFSAIGKALDFARQLERELAEARDMEMLKAQQCTAERLRANAAEEKLAQSATQFGSRWRDTKVTVPCDGDDVLGYWCPSEPGGNFACGVVHYYSGRWRDPEVYEDDCRAPDFWMPLPKAPSSAKSAR